MTFDELEKNIREIRKKGLNIMVENLLISEERAKYHETFLRKELDILSTRFRKNIKFLGSIHGEYCSAQKIKQFMGIDIDVSLNKILYEDYNLYSFRMALAVSEFYGLPLEILLFQDIEIHYDVLKKEYPALYKQSRH